jgi:hypothetical protein
LGDRKRSRAAWAAEQYQLNEKYRQHLDDSAFCCIATFCTSQQLFVRTLDVDPAHERERLPSYLCEL